jgi:hypothetical protein
MTKNGDAASGVPPLMVQREQSRDGSATLALFPFAFELSLFLRASGSDAANPAAWGYTRRRSFQAFVGPALCAVPGMAQRASPTVQKREDIEISLSLNPTWP